MFKPVSPKLNVTLLEEEVLRQWKHRRIFEKTDEQRRDRPEFVFFEGPPTANGRPGVHHVLSRAYKDIFTRYKIMCGYHVVRRGGWDTHGLPVELEVEKKLGFTSKSQIEEYGIARFNELCRQSAFDYILEWERLTDRIAFWVDMENAYITYSNPYIESVWWILKTLWEKDLLYQGHKVVPYCPRCGTPLSDHEVALGYQQAEDPSIFVRFPLVEDPGTSLLVWTTTPWTLPGNVAVAVHPDVDYVIVERDLEEGGVEKLILAKSQLAKVFQEEPVRVFETFKGRKLKGLRYQPLFTFLLPDKPSHFVILEEFVTTEDGSGLVHIAPAFGAEDMQSAAKYDLPLLMTVKEDGTFVPEVRPWRGRFVKDADPLIVQDLAGRGLLYRAETVTHTYPFCWRCDTPLLYYARSTWYIRTTQYRQQLVDLNQRIHWYPEHIRDGRFGNWLENNVDWALGRERYWGTPLPVWECPDCHHQVCIGSLAELSEMAERDLAGLDLHRPYVDEIKLVCPQCGSPNEPMERVPELIDVWFDSGSMPVAQWHYPFENQQLFERQFPADFISEAVDQTRGWFYSLHAISTMLFERECFKNVICLGLVLDANGQKMSKSRGNIVDPWDVLYLYGADAFRWHLYTAGPPGQERRFSKEAVGEVLRNFTLTLWNVYAFFVTYASLDQWQPEVGKEATPYTDLDRWLLSELNGLVRQVTHALDHYDVPGATRPVQDFVENLSKWYLRRSRRRFWKSESDEDKSAAYSVLYEVLITLSKLLAPTMPFLADEIYQNLVYNLDRTSLESVHLAAWPQPDLRRIDEDLDRDMKFVMRLASLGHAARNQAGIKVRQPLLEVAFSASSMEEAAAIERFSGLLADELNVRQVRVLGSSGEAVTYQLKPLPRQLGQKYKGLFPKVSQAIEALDAELAAPSLLAGESVSIQVEGNQLVVNPDEVEVRTEPRHGLTVVSDGPYLAALKIELTPELELEGLAREFIRRVQEFRKQSNLEIADRIALEVCASERLAQAIETHRDYIMGEVLAQSLQITAQPNGEFNDQQEFDGESAQISLTRL